MSCYIPYGSFSGMSPPPLTEENIIKVQPMYDPAEIKPKVIYVTGKPIELFPSSSFEVVIPAHHVQDLAIYLDGHLVSKLCQCDSRTLFQHGCQCGGV